MNKALGYAVIAVILGLVLTLVPAYLFIANASDQGWSPEQRSFTLKFPLIGQSDSNHIEKVSAKELEVLGVGFVVASAVYILFKRRTPRRNYVWLPPRSC